jgi:hypothetical protein
VTLRQDAVLPPLDAWLARKFGPHHLTDTIDELAAAAAQPDAPGTGQDDREAKIGECDRKLAGYRAALDAGADPAVVARWFEAGTRWRRSSGSVLLERPVAERISRQQKNSEDPGPLLCETMAAMCPQILRSCVHS